MTNLNSAFTFCEETLGLFVLYQLGQYAGITLGETVVHLNAEGDALVSASYHETNKRRERG